MLRTFIAAAALTLSTGSLAAAPEQPAEPETRPEKTICRTERLTGSLTRRTRICLTEAQLREVNDRTRRGSDEMTSSASGGCRALAPSSPSPAH